MNPKTILVADDDDGIRFAIVCMLSDKGHKVLEATDEKSIITLADKAELWIIDARLPTNGYEGLLAVSSLKKKGVVPTYPILFMSVDPDTFAADRLAALTRMGLKYEWLDKPFEPEYLLERIDTLVAI